MHEIKSKLSETVSSALIMHHFNVSQRSAAKPQRFVITILALGFESITNTFIPLTLEI